MNIPSIVVIIIILTAAVFALRHILRNRKSGCMGCSGCCEKCIHNQTDRSES